MSTNNLIQLPTNKRYYNRRDLWARGWGRQMKGMIPESHRTYFANGEVQHVWYDAEIVEEFERTHDKDVWQNIMLRMQRQYSRPYPPKVESNPIERINQTAHEQLRFRDMVSLKVPGGRDQYSAMRGAKLWAAIAPEAKELIELQIEGPKYRDAAARWHLRGLEISRAIRKVKSDAEVANNAIRGRDFDAKEYIRDHY